MATELPELVPDFALEPEVVGVADVALDSAMGPSARPTCTLGKFAVFETSFSSTSYGKCDYTGVS